MSLSVSTPLDWDAVAWHTVSVGPSAGAGQPAGAREESGTFCFEERAVVWRVIGSVVYLVEHSLDAHLQQSGVRLVFSSFVCPDPSFFFSAAKQHLRMIVLTADGSLHRFTFEGQFSDSVFVAVCNFAELMGSGEATVSLPSSMHEQFDRVLVNARPLRVAAGFQDASVVVSTRSGTIVVCSLLAGGTAAEQPLAQMDAAGLVTLQQSRDEAFCFALSRSGQFAGYALSSRQLVESVQLNDRGAGVRGLALRMFVRDARRVHLLALVQSATSGVQVQTVQVDFPGSAIGLELVACETIPSASAAAAIVDFTEGPAGLVCLHADGSVSCKVGNVWQVARAASLGQVIPSSVSSTVEWTHFCQSLKSDPFVSRYLLRAVHRELATRGFVGEEDDLASAVFAVPSHERESVLRVFLECHAQTRLGSSVGRLGHAGLPVLVGPGGLSVLFPLPALALWPEVPQSEKRRLFDLCRLTDNALSPEQWLQFDAESFSVGPEEACLGAMRRAVATPLPLELPLLWSRFQSEDEGVAALSQLLGELCDSALPPDVWSSPLSPISAAAVPLSGPVPTHAAACAVRSGAEGHYLLLRSLLVTMHVLLASHHRSVSADDRGALRGTLIPKAAAALRLFSNLRAALRAPNSDQSLVGPAALPFASAARCLSSALSQLCARFSSAQQPVGIASFSLYALFVSLRSPVLLMRALAACREYDALACLACGGGATEKGDVAGQFFAGVAKLQRSQFEEAFGAFRGAAVAARNQGSLESLARVSGDLPVGSFGDAYFLNVIAQFEKRNCSEMVVKAAEFALATAEDSNRHIFLNKSFRHNLKLKRFGEAYLSILASPGGEMAARKLRRFVVEVCVTATPAMLCEFPFVGHHMAAVAEVLAELAAVSDWKDVNYGEVLYAFHSFRGNFRDASGAAYALAAQQRADSDVPAATAEQSLSLAVAALRLATKQWIVVPKERPIAGRESTPKRRADSEQKLSVDQSQQRIITLLQMQQELAMASARAVLPRFHVLVSPGDALSLLVAAGRIARALFLGRVFDLDLSAAFEKMTRNALRNAPLLGDSSDEMADLVGNGKSAWTNLEQQMREYDSRKSNFAYGKTIARTLISEGAEKLPAWLAQFLASNHPEALLQIYLSFSMLGEAHELALAMLARPGQLVPFNLLDKMMADQSYEPAKQQALRAALMAASAPRR